MVDSTRRIQGSKGFGARYLDCFRTTTTAMSSLDSELEEQLAEAGDKLVDPPESVEELLPLLDQLQRYLSNVEQSPRKSTQRAYSTSVKALVCDKLFKHSDTDVRVAVASCISEITRISAPDAPYEDDKMKEVFQLIVSSFENLSDKSSRSYEKRSSILGTVAKVRSCVVMLDLECDALILEMFQRFFKEIREYHPENVFFDMEIIMTLVIEESEDVSPELVSLILTTVKKDNEVSPIVKRLGERVLQKCTSKLEPYLPQVLKSLGVSSNDYSRIVSSICLDTTDATDQNDVHLDDGQKLHEEPAEEVATPQQVDAAPDRSPQSVMSTGEVKEDKDDSLADSASAKKEEHGQESNVAEETINCESNKKDIEDAAKIESQPAQKKRRGRKPRSSRKPTANSANGPRSDNKETDDMEIDKLQEPQNDIPSSASEKQTVEDNLLSESYKEAVIEPLFPHADEDEPVKDVSPSHSEDLPKEDKPKKGRRGRKKKTLAKDATPVPEISKKTSEEMSEDEVETPRKIVDEKPSEADDDIDTTSDSEAKSIKQPAKKAGAISTRKPEDKKRKTKSKMVSEKQVKTSAKEDVDKVGKKRGRDENHIDETPSDHSNKKRTPAREDISDHSEYGEELVGSRIKVWWPMDKAFYKGEISSFDPVKKKHTVSYVDGDKEVLLLKKERWKIVSDDDESESDQEHVEDEESPDASPERSPKKRGRTKLGRPRKDKTETSSKKGGSATASGKSKQAATTSGRKFKSSDKIENGSDAKLKSQSYKTKESEAKTPKTPKSKESEAMSSANKSKQETPKNIKSKQQEDPATPKGKTPKTGGKSTANGSGKGKAVSSKSKTQVSKSGPGKKRRRVI